MILQIIGLSCLSGFFYRAGGTGGKWYLNTKVRDLGCPLATYSALLLFWYPANWFGWLMLFLAFGLTFGALTTYFDWLFGYDNFYMHGFILGLAALPLAWVGITWWIILIRAILLGIAIGMWSKLIKWDVIEEWGRGFLLTISILLFLL